VGLPQSVRTEAARGPCAQRRGVCPAGRRLALYGGALKGVLARAKDLDLVIEKAAPEWPLERIAPVDRNVLRLGLYELLFADREKVPAKVAINEAIELAKSFGGENSGRFVNGVLGAVYKELGEPGKDEVSKKKKDVPYDQMPQERLGGAVVYAKQRQASCTWRWCTTSLATGP
jgi:transcription antitermination factor NusB